jgi:hypothetical protein
MDRPDSSPSLAHLADVELIRSAIIRYARGVDRADGSLIRSAFHPGATMSHGSYAGTAEDFAEQYCSVERTGRTAVMHALAQIAVDVDDAGDAATSESYFVCYLRLDDDGTEVVDAFGGRYLDSWARIDGRWGIVDRLTVYDWRNPGQPGPRPMFRDVSAFAPGRWGTDDPSYGRRPA